MSSKKGWQWSWQSWTWKSWWKPLIAVAAWIAIYEWVFHGWMLKDWYMATADLWRTPEEMWNTMWIMGAAWIIFAGWMVWLYPKGYEGNGKWEGARFGLWMGILFSSLVLAWWAILPVPAAMAWAWLVGTLIECIGAGAVLGWTWKPAK
jgi:hypothetical protein